MSDDQDGCEWVSVSSGTLPTWIVAGKGPLNGCVCVFVATKLTNPPKTEKSRPNPWTTLTHTV